MIRPTPVVRLSGDRFAAEGVRGDAMRELQTLDRLNVNDLEVCSRRVRRAGGGVIVCRREFGRRTADIFVPTAQAKQKRPGSGSPTAEERERFVYVVPDCVARYDGLYDLVNNIPDGSLAGWGLGTGRAISILPEGECGLRPGAALPDAGMSREYNVFRLPGGKGSGLLYADGHIPQTGAFSVSCLFRLNAALEYDHDFDDKDVVNPLRTYFLKSGDGTDWTWDCPGSLSPVIGFCSPRLNPAWEETFTYPWAPWNEDFSANTEVLAGAFAAGAACPEAPPLAGEPGSAYWDAAGPNPYPHPMGFVTGVQATGLFVYNGDRLMVAKISDYTTQYGYEPIITGAVKIGTWHHAAATYDEDGAAALYLAELDAPEATAWTGLQPKCALDEAFTGARSGVNHWTLSSENTGEIISEYRMNPAMDVALPRFYHYALSAGQAYMLQLEAFGDVFVADDHEAGELAGKGYTPILVGREEK